MAIINTSDDLLRLLREDQVFYEQARRLILTDELINLPQQVAELVKVVAELSAKFDAFAEAANGRLAVLEEQAIETNGRLTVLEEQAIETNGRLTVIESDVGTLKSDVGTLKSDVGTLKSDVATLKTQVSALQGTDLECQARRNILNIASNSLGLTGGRILVAQGRDPSRGFVDAIDRAEEGGLVNPEQADHVLLADIIIYARRQNTYAVFEVSRTINTDDIARARDRAAAVAAITGTATIPAVVGQIIHPPQQAQAEATGVRVIIPNMMRDQEAAAAVPL